MSFRIRRTVVGQVVHLTQLVPVLNVLSAPVLRATGLSQNEVQPKQTKDGKNVPAVDAEEADASFQLFCYKPPRGIISGSLKSIFNVTGAFIAAPIFSFTGIVTGLIDDGPIGFLKGFPIGAIYGTTVFTVGVAAAFFQLVYGARNTLVAPYQLMIKGRKWHPFLCEFVEERGLEKDEVLATSPPSEDLYHAALKRYTHRRGGERSGTGAVVGPEASVRHNVSTEYYQILGIDPSASAKEIKTAFNKLAMKWHPDKNSAPNAKATFEKITKAYKVLKDPAKKKAYDAGGEKALKEDDSISKREALRGVFGGDALTDLVGDVVTGRWQRRNVDDLYYLPDELLVVQMRMVEDCVEVLLSYLDGHTGVETPRQAAESAPSSGSSSGKDSNPLFGGKAGGMTRAQRQDSPPAGPNAEWQRTVRKRMLDYINVGIAKEVLHVVGSTYRSEVEYFRASPLGRAQIRLVKATPKRLQHKYKIAQLVVGFRNVTKEDSAFVMNAVWTFAEPDLEATAQAVAHRILFDTSVDEKERQRRASALADLATEFIVAGKPFEKVSPAVLETVRASVAQEMMRKRRAKQQQQQQQ